MKEQFLNSKCKKVLRAICEKLNVIGFEKKPKEIIVKKLLEFSTSQLKNAYNQTNFGINRNYVIDALKKYPDDKNAKLNLEKLNQSGF